MHYLKLFHNGFNIMYVFKPRQSNPSIFIFPSVNLSLYPHNLFACIILAILPEAIQNVNISMQLLSTGFKESSKGILPVDQELFIPRGGAPSFVYLRLLSLFRQQKPTSKLFIITFPLIWYPPTTAAKLCLRRKNNFKGELCIELLARR